MGTWLNGLFTGSSPTETGDINQAGGISGTETALGEGAQNAGIGFQEGILSGNQGEISKLLAPQISDIAQQAQQKTQTNAEFGNRSGGTNASNQQTTDTARASVNDMISKLTGSAASALPGEGQAAVNTGLQANEVQDQEAQQELENFQNSILGGVATGVVSNLGTGLSEAGSGLVGF
jgi:hypothetical protein